MKNHSILAICVAFAGLCALPVFAQYGHVQATASDDVTAGGVLPVSVSATGSASADAMIQVHLPESPVSVSAEQESQDASDTKENEQPAHDTQEGTTTEQGSAGSVISVSAREVHGWDAQQKQEFLGTVKTQAQVRSQQDLENFAKGVLVKDENVAAVSADGHGDVVVTYNVPAKLFGVIATQIPVSASVTVGTKDAGDGAVKITYPWYRFLYSVPFTAVQGDVEAQAQTQVSGDESVMAVQLQDKEQMQAQVIATLSNILQASSNTDAEVTHNIK